jgi:hypothetical protein
LENLAERLTTLAAETDAERLIRAESAAISVDMRRAELIASARSAIARTFAPDASPAARVLTHEAERPDLAVAAAALASLPALVRERFSMAGSERRALLEFALENAADVGAPRHLRPLLFMAEQGPHFFSTTEQRVSRAESAKRLQRGPFGVVDDSFVSDPSDVDLWGVVNSELWLGDAGGRTLAELLTRTHRVEFNALHEALSLNRKLRASLAERSHVVASLSASIQSVLTPAQFLAFQDYLSRNADRIRGLMPASRAPSKTQG